MYRKKDIKKSDLTSQTLRRVGCLKTSLFQKPQLLC